MERGQYLMVAVPMDALPVCDKRQLSARSQGSTKGCLGLPHAFGPGALRPNGLANVRLGSKADMATCRTMSVLPPKADIDRPRKNVRLVPKAAIHFH